MEREIKFRCWNEKKNKFIYYNGWLPPKYGNEFICLFTGLHDKNGKEIYEGDIVKFENNHKANSYFNVEIKWDDKFARFLPFDQADSESSPPLYINLEEKSFEVIGNIYENPNLLTPSKNKNL